ncbi:uncharacterized protein LOC125210350 [Salvia hispanica]|uniref:uncharacterized protein LOC125210350 n=1 Tax=Salvia hispanica TaxID=49212 RepID=UPI002009D851|nr:uncharacterized protein LOC125210350 [Salvia hispanica]
MDLEDALFPVDEVPQPAHEDLPGAVADDPILVEDSDDDFEGSSGVSSKGSDGCLQGELMGHEAEDVGEAEVEAEGNSLSWRRKYKEIGFQSGSWASSSGSGSGQYEWRVKESTSTITTRSGLRMEDPFPFESESEKEWNSSTEENPGLSAEPEHSETEEEEDPNMAHLVDPDPEIGSLTTHLDGEPAHAIVSNPRRRSIDIKTNVLGVLPTFSGRRNECPYVFLNEFSKLCSIQKRPNEATEEDYRLRAIPFALKGEINIDVYPGREKELRERTGGDSVPQLFFNEKLIGGLAALNSLRNGGMLEAKLEEILATKCPDDAPAPPVYGFDEEGEVAAMDEMAEIVKVVRQRVPIQDRITKMKFVKNCFSGAELVEELIHQLDCGRKKAVEIGKQLARRHFIHHVFGDNEFEDGNHFYRFLEHEPFIPKCYNFRGVVNDSEPKDVAALSRRLTCIMSAILESYASDDRLHLDYLGISNSEEFRRYINVVEELQRVDLLTLSHDEKLAFFLNLHNSMAIHAVIRIGHPGGMIDRRPFFSDFMYVIGGHPYSLNSIRNGILRGNRRPPFSLIKPFSKGDKRLELSFDKVNQLIHFGMWNATRGSPSIRFFKCQGIESELKNAAREYFQREDGMQVDLAKRTVYLPRIFKWYSADFGQEKDIPNWIINYLDASKTGLLTHLISDGGSVNIAYQDYDWSINL